MQDERAITAQSEPHHAYAGVLVTVALIAASGLALGWAAFAFLGPG